jgi:hypothetical protein
LSGIGNSEPSTSWVFDKDNLEKRELLKNEVVYRDNPTESLAGVDVNLFGRLVWFNSLLDSFDLHESLSFEDKEALFDALFGFIPADQTDNYYRATAVGDYFGKGSHLILYARIYRPSDKAPKGSKSVLQFTGNFVMSENNQTGEIKINPLKGFILPNMNWFNIGIIFSNNLIVRASFLHSQEGENRTKEEAAGNIYMQYVNLADDYIKDEITANDDQALEMLNEAYDNATDLSIRLVAKLNTFLYYLYKDNIADAEEALAIVTQESERMEDLDSSLKWVINIEAPTMLEMYKNNTK